MDSAQKLAKLNEGLGESRIDVKKVFMFAKYLQDFLLQVELASEKCLDFWRELLKRQGFNANIFHSIGSQVTVTSLEIDYLVSAMLAINPHYGYLLRVYSLFLTKVLSNEEEGEVFTQRCVNSEKTFLAQERIGTPLVEDLSRNFSGDINFLVLVVRIQTSQFSIGDTNSVIEDINHEVLPMLGYHRADVRGKSLNRMMPQCIANMHD